MTNSVGPSEDLHEARGRLLLLHFPYEVKLASGRTVQVCSHCHTGDPYCTVSTDWPCPTIEVLDGADPGDYA